MHDIRFEHQHELEKHDFLGCCLNCQRSLMIIKPHVLEFYEKLKNHTRKTLAVLTPTELYRMYQLLDDIAHLNVGDRLAELILTDQEIRLMLPAIRFYYTTFFSLHEAHLAKEILEAAHPWALLESFPLYPRYETLVKKQTEVLNRSPNEILWVFIGCGPVPFSLILLNRLYGSRSIGLDTDTEAVSLARKCIARLGLERDISIVHGDESRLWGLKWNAILVAALAEPKARIFQNLRKVLKEQGHAPVIFRTYTGMRAVLHEPVQPGDIKGFKIVKAILPTEQVNNTTVLAELDE